MADDNDELNGYFTIREDKVTELMKNTTQMYYVVGQMIKDQIVTTEQDRWNEGPVNELMLYYSALTSIKNMLTGLINNPSKEVLRLTKKHSFEGVLVKGDDLLTLNQKLLESEQSAKLLEIDHRISLTVH